MSAAVVTLIVEAATALVPVITTILDQAKNGTVPTQEQIAAADTALDKLNDAIQAA